MDLYSLVIDGYESRKPYSLLLSSVEPIGLYLPCFDLIESLSDYSLSLLYRRVDVLLNVVVPLLMVSLLLDFISFD
jgi:hypothetical protein